MQISTMPQARGNLTAVTDIVDGILAGYDADGDGTLTYGFGGEHGVTGEALRTVQGMLEQTPHGPLYRVDVTCAIQSLITAADAVDGAITGSVSRLDLMAVIGALDLVGNDGMLDHDEYTSYQQLFRERVVDREHAQEVAVGDGLWAVADHHPRADR